MGSCYSRKAGGGKYTYTTVQMASTKLDDTSRLARPTPYCRNTPSGSSVLSTRKGIPVSTRSEHLPHHNQPNELKSVKNPSPLPLQSSIPRFNSNITPANAKGEINENIINVINDRNENNQLHIVNNNLVSGSQPANRVAESPKSSCVKKMSEIRGNKFSTNSKSCPEYISSQIKVDDKALPSRIPAKLNTHTPVSTRSLLPQFVMRSSPAASNANYEPQAQLKPHSCDKSNLSRQESEMVNNKDSLHDTPVESVLSKSSTFTSESHDSITDSGLGSSLIEKNKQDDGDTLKDVERLECYEDVDIPEGEKHVTDIVIKSPESTEKMSLKCPSYKRELNGKWTLEEKNLYGLHKNSSLLPDSKIHDNQCQPLKSPYKVNSMNSSFPTYASYKGLISYKKYATKMCESVPSGQTGDKILTHEKSSKGPITDSSYIPKMSNASVNVKHGSNKDISKALDDVEVLKSNSTLRNVPSPSSSKQSSLESDDKSDGVASDTKSPPSEIENREFLIDDEISDQPSLISFVSEKTTDSTVLSLQQSVTELHALQSLSCNLKKACDGQKVRRERLGSDHRDSLLLSFEMGSSCSSIASDDLMLDYEKKIDFPEGTVNEGLASPIKKIPDLEQIEEQASESEKLYVSVADEKARKRLYRRSSGPFVGGGGLGKEEWRLRSVSLPLRPPRPMSVSEADDGSVVLDSSSYRLLSQDLNGVKTLLLRLKTVIQEAETINPFDHVNTKNLFYHSLVHGDTPGSMTHLTNEKQGNKSNPVNLALENADLHRQLVLLQQQLEEKNRTIHLLQQQMTKYTNTSYVHYENVHSVNAATQTERTRSLTGSLSSSLENSCETLVSVQDISDEHLEGTSKDLDNLQNQITLMSEC